MTQSAYLPPQLNPDSPVLQKLRKLLLKAGYCDAGVSPTFENPAPTIPTDIPSGSALYTLLRLFFDRDAVSTELFEAALHPLSLEQLLSVGFCRMEGNQVVSNVLLQPYEDQLFAMGEITLPPRPEDNIMRISKASFELAHLITPRHARNALDLGTGCGFLATLLSPQADRVYALDLNSAAIQFAEFNARWNSFRNITCLQGNLFGPVREIRFDHIVCNPPFLICPVPDSAANEILFLHSGQQGDSFCFQIVRESASFLEEGGILNMMFSWIQTEGQEWHARPNRAFSGLGCDAWCLRTSEESPEDYVSSWLALLPDQGNLDVDTLRRQGLEFFQQQKIGAVGTGFLTLRKYTSRANHLWFDDAPDDRSEPFGSSVAKVFDLRAKFDSVPEEIILQQKFEVAPDTANIQKSVRKGRRWEAIASELCRESGLKYTFSGVDPILLEIVMRLDGKTSLREILARLSRERRLPLSRLIANRLPSLRELLRFGFILPATAGPPSSKQRRSAK